MHFLPPQMHVSEQTEHCNYHWASEKWPNESFGGNGLNYDFCDMQGMHLFGVCSISEQQLAMCEQHTLARGRESREW